MATAEAGRPRPHVSTGELPHHDTVLDLVRQAHERYGTVSDGAVADYIPALAEASPDWFGICVAGRPRPCVRRR